MPARFIASGVRSMANFVLAQKDIDAKPANGTLINGSFARKDGRHGEVKYRSSVTVR